MTERKTADLEARLAWIDDAVQELNRVVAEQHRRIVRLEEANRLLAERIRELGESLPDPLPTDEKPPHY